MGWIRRVINVLAPGRHARELDREIAFHIAETTDALVARGMSPEDAAREATRRFGPRTQLKERTRDADIVAWLESLLADLRYAGRTLRASPGFTLAALLSLGLGIGANTAIFSLVNAVLLRSLPVAQPERLAKITLGEDGTVFTNPQWEAIRDLPGIFDGAFAVGTDQFNLAPSGQARMADVDLVSGAFFTTLGVHPAAGRLLQPADDHRGCPALAVISHGFWLSRFGGGAGAIGSSLMLGGQPFTVVGVADRVFTGVEVGTFPQVYVPLCSAPLLYGDPAVLERRTRWWLELAGRLPPGETVAGASARLAAAAPAVFAATLPADAPKQMQDSYLRNTLGAMPGGSGFSGLRRQYRRALVVLMAVVGVVLLIACANVANLLLARTATRERELALRLALGAGRGRVIRQVMTESLLLATLGGLVGLLFARWSTHLLVGLIGGGNAPVSLDLSLDSRVLGFTLAVAVATGILFGVAPAWRSVRLDPNDALKLGGQGWSAGGGAVTLRRVLVVGQVALSLVLVALAGLLLGTFRALATVDPGFRPAHVILARLDFAGLDLPQARRLVAGRELLDRIRAVPGVSAASASVITPISGRFWNSFVVTEGFEPQGFKDIVWFNGVTDGYFATLETPLVAGRDFAAGAGDPGRRVAIVNQAMARKLFGQGNPLGRQIRVKNGEVAEPPMEVIGVVADAKYRSLRDSTLPTAYVPWAQAEDFRFLTFEVRSDLPEGDAVAGMLAAARQVLPSASFEISTLAGQVADSIARERLLAVLSGFFGGLALLLALIGLYGTTSYNVTRRRKELGIRTALGASRVRLVRMVVGEVGRMVTLGLVLGGAATLASTRLVRAFLYGRTPTDPLTLTLATLAVAAVALAAGAIPVLRATREQVQTVLREE